MTKQLSLVSGTEVLSALTPTVYNTTESAIDRFPPEQRNCYQEDEFDFPNLRWEDGYRYSIKNCL
jgi:hypothetical protein